MKKLTLLAIILLSFLSAAAQQFRLKGLPTQHELPVANIHCILQDSEGYMWYGTTGGGVCRDNGYQLDVFRSDSRHPSWMTTDDVTALAEDRRGNILVGTRQGLYLIDKKTYSVGPYLLEVVGKREVRALMRDKGGNVWVGAGDVVVRVDAAGRESGRYLSRWRGKKAGVSHFSLDERGDLWMSQWGGGLCKYNKRKNAFEPRPWSFGYFPQIMIPCRSGGFWISTWGAGIVHYDVRTGVITPQPLTMGDERRAQVIDMMRDSHQGLLWVTTMDDLYLYREEAGRLEEVDTRGFLPPGGKILDGLAKDADGNVWVAGFKPRTFIVTRDRHHIDRYEVPEMQQTTGYPLLADRVVADGGGFWIWQGRIGLMRYDAASGGLTAYDERKYSREIEKCVGEAGIWASCENTLFKLTSAGAQSVAVVPDVITCVRAIDGDYVYIGTNKGLYRYGLLGGNCQRMAETSAAVTDISVDATGEVYYVVSGKGLFQNKGQLVSNLYISAISVSPDGTLWAGTQQGRVMYVENGRLVVDSLASDERGDAIKDLLHDEQGHLWILSDQRLKEYHAKTRALRLLSVDDPQIDVSYFYHLEPVDGRSVCVDGAGAFCIVQSSAELNRQKAKSRQPKVTAIEMDDSVHLMGKDEQCIRIPSRTGSIGIRLTTMEHVHAADVTFAYQLKGWNKTWERLPKGANVVHVANLPKGEYTLMVMATDAYGCWSEPEAVFTISRDPLWWET